MNKTSFTRRSCALLSACSALLIGSGLSRAASIEWQMSDTANWNVGMNWTGGQVPTSVDSVLLKNVVFNGPNTVVIPTAYLATYDSLTIDSQTNHFTNLEVYGALIGNSANISSRGGVKLKGGQWLNTGALAVGSGAGSFIEITDGGTFVNQGSVSIGGGGSGSVTVTNGSWGVDGNITVSSPASATMVVNGGLVTSQTGIVATGGVSGVGGGGDGTVTVSSGTWKIATNLTIAGIYSSGTINVSGGGLLEVGGNTYVGLDPTYSHAVVNLSGASGNRGVLSTNRVISAGDGFLFERNAFTFDGGVLQARSNQGDFITAFRPGDVTISGGGAFIDTNGFAIGINANTPLSGAGGLTKLGAGTLTLSNANTYAGGTIVQSGTLVLTGTINHPSAETRIGNASGDNGFLTIANGSLSNTYGFLGATAGATGSATITSGIWANSLDLYAGYGGNGNLRVDGGAVSARSLYLASGGSGTATVNAGTLTVADTLMVGQNSGTARLAVNGGVVASTQSLIGNGATGSVVVTGGTWNNSGNILLGGGGSLAVSGGVVNVSGTVLTGISTGTSTISLSGSSGARGVLSTSQVFKAGAAGAVNFDGGILRARASNNDFFFLFSPGEVTVGQGGAFIDSNGFSIGITATLSGSGGLTKMGAGRLSLSGSNSYGGGTVIEGGTLRLDHDKALGASSSLAVNSGTLDLNGHGVTVTSLSGSSGATITTGTAGELALTVNQSADTTFAGSIRDGSGKVHLLKQGSGTLVLSGSNSYTGDTYVRNGTLLINGDISSSSLVFVDDNCAFGGNGIAGDVHVTDLGVLAPGNSPGLLTIKGDLAMDANSILEMEFTGTGSGQFDQLDVDGLFNAAGSILYLDVSYAAAYGDSFHIFTDELPSAGSFTIDTNLGGGLSWDTSQLSTAGIISVVPEPSAATLIVLGLGVGCKRRRK